MIEIVKRLISVSVLVLILELLLPEGGVGRFAKGVFALLELVIVIQPAAELLK